VTQLALDHVQQDSLLGHLNGVSTATLPRIVRPIGHDHKS
jgi:hypothetical protein